MVKSQVDGQVDGLSGRAVQYRTFWACDEGYEERHSRIETRYVHVAKSKIMLDLKDEVGFGLKHEGPTELSDVVIFRRTLLGLQGLLTQRWRHYSMLRIERHTGPGGWGWYAKNVLSISIE